MDLLQWCFGQQRYIIFEASPSHTQLFPCLDFGVRNKRERERGGWTCVWEGKSSERHPSGRESGWKKRERCLQVRMGCKETQGWRPYQKPLEWCLTSQSKVFSLFFWVYCIMFLCGVFVHLNDFFFLFFLCLSPLWFWGLGIMFQDITTLLLDHKAFKDTVDIFVDRYRDMGISVVAGILSLSHPFLSYFFSLEVFSFLYLIWDRGFNGITICQVAWWPYFSLILVFIYFLNLLLVIGNVIKWVRRESFSLLRNFCFHFSLSSSKTLMGRDDFVWTLSLVESLFFLFSFLFIISCFHLYFFLGFKTRCSVKYISMAYNVIFGPHMKEQIVTIISFFFLLIHCLFSLYVPLFCLFVPVPILFLQESILFDWFLRLINRTRMWLIDLIIVMVDELQKFLVDLDWPEISCTMVSSSWIGHHSIYCLLAMADNMG